MNLDNEFISTPQVMALLKVNRPRVSQLARRLRWQSREIPSDKHIKAKEYLASDVQREVDRRANQRPPET